MLRRTPSTHWRYRRPCGNVGSTSGPTWQCLNETRPHPSPAEVHILSTIARRNGHPVLYQINRLLQEANRHHRKYHWWRHEDTYLHYPTQFSWNDRTNPWTADPLSHGPAVYGSDQWICRTNGPNQRNRIWLHRSGPILLWRKSWVWPRPWRMRWRAKRWTRKRTPEAQIHILQNGQSYHRSMWKEKAHWQQHKHGRY